MSEWLNPFNNFPGWRDGDRPIELRLDDGKLVSGRLVLIDVFPSGDGDESPYWRVVDPANTFPDESDGVAFTDAESFRWLD